MGQSIPGFGFTIQNVNRVIAELKALEPKVKNKICRQALRKAAKPVATVAKQLAPKKTGQLRKAIKVRAMKRSRRGVGIEVLTGKDFFQGDQFYGAFQEFGWHAGPRKASKKRGYKRIGDKRRWIEGKHFLEGAYDRQGQASKEIALRLIAQGINNLKAASTNGVP